MNDEGEIVGLMTFGGDLVRGQEIQGFNFIVTSNTVKEFLVQAGATNEGGTADKNYRDGLELYRDQRYSAALEKFEKVQKLFPQHSEVTSLIQDCEAKIETEGSSWFWIILGSVVAAGLFGAASLTSAVIFLVVRSKGMRPQFT